MEAPIDKKRNTPSDFDSDEEVEKILKREAEAGALQGEPDYKKRVWGPRSSMPAWIKWCQENTHVANEPLPDIFVPEPPPRDERKEITDELGAGKHTLWLEHNRATNAKCRAFDCLVGGGMQSRYLLNLQINEPSGAWWTELGKTRPTLLPCFLLRGHRRRPRKAHETPETNELLSPSNL